MIRITYIIPISGSHEDGQTHAERTRVGNIFDTTRQKVIINRNTEAGESTLDVCVNVDTFTDLDNSSNKVTTLTTSATAPLVVPTQTPLTSNTTAASTAYVDAAVTAGGGGGTLSTVLTAGRLADATGTIKTFSNVLAIDINNSQLIDSGVVLSADWENRVLKNSTAVLSLDWEWRALCDNAGSYSLLWGARTLVNAGGGIVLNWGTYILYSNATPALSINWDTRNMYNDSGVSTLNWQSRTLNVGIWNYNADYSASYTARTVVDKEFVQKSLKAYVAKTGTYTAAATDYCINCTSGTFTIDLPTAVGITGKEYIIKNSGAGVITIDGSGAETIDGSATQTANANDSYKIMSTGTNWIII